MHPPGSSPSAIANAAAAARRILLPEVLDVQDLAFWLRCSPSFVRALLRAGELPGCRIGRRWLVTRAALLSRLESTLETSDRALPQLQLVRDHVLSKPADAPASKAEEFDPLEAT